MKIDSLLILKQPVITANSRHSFVFKADSNRERIDQTIHGNNSKENLEYNGDYGKGIQKFRNSLTQYGFKHPVRGGQQNGQNNHNRHSRADSCKNPYHIFVFPVVDGFEEPDSVSEGAAQKSQGPAEKKHNRGHILSNIPLAVPVALVQHKHAEQQKQRQLVETVDRSGFHLRDLFKRRAAAAKKGLSVENGGCVLPGVQGGVLSD